MTIEQIKQFILAGNSTFTLYSSKIDKRHTYKIEADKACTTRFLVYVLFGPDNCNDYKFLGWFYTEGNNNFELSNDRQRMQFKMLNAFLEMVNKQKMVETCHFYPSGNCGRCGRKLTTPESIEIGIGPKCRQMILGG